MGEGWQEAEKISLTSAAEIDVFRSVIEVLLPIQTKTSAPQSSI